MAECLRIHKTEILNANKKDIFVAEGKIAPVMLDRLRLTEERIDAMADALYAIVKYPAMYKSLRELGRDEVNNIKWYDAGLKVRRIYDMVLGW